jgi:hypothetical protein
MLRNIILFLFIFVSVQAQILYPSIVKPWHLSQSTKDSLANYTKAALTVSDTVELKNTPGNIGEVIALKQFSSTDTLGGGVFQIMSGTKTKDGRNIFRSNVGSYYYVRLGYTNKYIYRTYNNSNKFIHEFGSFVAGGRFGFFRFLDYSLQSMYNVVIGSNVPERNVIIGSDISGSSVNRDDITAFGSYLFLDATNPNYLVSVGSEIVADGQGVYIGNSIDGSNSILIGSNHPDDSFDNSVIIGNDISGRLSINTSNIFIGNNIYEQRDSTLVIAAKPDIEFLRISPDSVRIGNAVPASFRERVTITVDKATNTAFAIGVGSDGRTFFTMKDAGGKTWYVSITTAGAWQISGSKP